MRTSVKTITLGFSPSRIFAESIEQYHRTRNPALVYEHFYVDQHYPVDKEKNRAENHAICERFGIRVLDPGRNLGLHDGFNWALDQIKPVSGDVIIAYDPDMFPLSPGWDMALVRAIRGDPEKKVVWSSVMNPRSRADIESRGYRKKYSDGFIEIWVTKTAVTNSACAWDYDWLKSIGGLTEPGPWYGHLESAMFSRLRGKEWAFLPGWIEDDHLRDMHDRAYVVYKWHLAHLKTTKDDFETWLKHWDPATDKAAPARIP